MHVKRQRGWEISENLITPENVFLNRRAFIAAAGATGLIAASGGSARAISIFGPSVKVEDTIKATAKDPTAGLYPVERNETYKLARDLTPEELNAAYNNFYEFGSAKQIYDKAQDLKLRPWDIMIDGDVEKPFTIGFDDLIKKVNLEERHYRHRCVEAWSMTVPWTGFAMADLVKIAKPLSSAKYVRMETFLDKEVSSAQAASFGYPWPYVEGVTMAEAMNELAFMVTGAYGKPLAKQFGAPIRLHLPWKYGFKSIKSITRITFTDKRPVSFWEQLAANEYGFWANVNPQVPHPRWSQASERVLGGGNERIPTRLFNGYGDYVADLYKGLEGEVLYR